MSRFKGWNKKDISVVDKFNSVLIGIDPGTKTGVAVKENGKLIRVETMTIFQAIEVVLAWERTCLALDKPLLVRVEDARLRTYFGNTGREILQGAGSVKRDCAIWQEVLEERAIHHQFVHPQNVKATTAKQFEQITGWKKQTSIHAREAAWLVT
jgi:hypothetical protein